MAEPEAASLPARSRAALGDRFLQQALATATGRFQSARHAAFADFADVEAYRERARRIKEATLQRLDEYLDQLADQVERAGGVVHWATDAAEARAIVLDLARRHGVRTVVKSKSMATEEIHLNDALAAAGLEVTETDLGEYIIQLAGHRPSHIVGPAVHLSAEQIAEILSKPAGQRLPAEREVLAGFARKALRQKFAEADVGISGVNFAIAETGSIVLVTNEGNGRLTCALPKCHIAVMGMEKVIPKLADLPHFLKVLARAATGQKLSVYTQLITGPRQSGELDGPDEFHLVILDNGRSRILGSPLRESLFCIRCGACLNACPIYRSVGGHSYGGVYAGPIGAVLTPLYDGLAANHHLPHASSLCGACQAACPVKIQIPEMLIQLREQLHHEPGHKSRLEALAYGLWARSLRSPWLYRLGTWLATRTIGRFKRSDPWLKRLPGKLHGWTAKRDFPAPSAERFRDWWNSAGSQEEGHDES